MNLTKEQLEQLKEMAYNLVTPELAAINLEVNELEFMTDLRTMDTPVHRAYYSGFLRQLMETRQAIIKAAHNGSNPAQLELLKMIRQVTNDINHA